MHAQVRANVLLCSLVALTQAFYVPGFSYKSYRDGDTIPLLVNKVYSDNSQLQYAYAQLPFTCPPTGRIRSGRFTSGTSISLNLGEVLRGDRITVSDYELVMGTDEEARYLCSHTMDIDGLRRTKDLIRDGYKTEWIVDNLPGATSLQTTDKQRKYYAAGFRIGEEVRSVQGGPPQYVLNNHVTLVIRYHRAPGRDGEKGRKVVVGFEVFPRSITASGRNESGIPTLLQSEQEPFLLVPRGNSTSEDDESEATSLTAPFTYSVYWREEEKLEWQNRWDMYLMAQDDSSNIHWLAIVTSLVVSGLLTVAVAVVLARTVRGDIAGSQDGVLGASQLALKPSKSPTREKGGLLDKLGDVEGRASLSDDEDTEDITGWKLIHGDVFRTPQHGSLLAPLVGSGIQLLFMAMCLLILSAAGILNPSFRGGYISVGTGLFVFAGLFSGYYSSRIYRTFGGRLWRENVLVTASLVPGLLFATVFILNLFVWIQASSTAIPFGTLIALVLLWLFIQLPLVYMGGWYGFERVGAWSHPIKPNAIPRQLPAQPWRVKTTQAILLAGLPPFMVIFIELTCACNTLWSDKSTYYYAFGFTSIVGAILAIAIVEVSVIATYLLLCAENYNWWWHSFLVGASSALWIFAYLVYYFFSTLHISGFVSGLLFFAYGALACALYALLAGSLGFLAAYAFVMRLYAAVKID
ncbi:multispanning membrane protein [Dothidotthia symphoricarpi CBS 119687]|uniref:Transmembrane 9 superfamily member n=1 Tax=Dothidotthia symphoricarpi CBS 119687 TaxID=1392245 RepID=A0A6A6AB20_9PLEO|nr:multispanning membrane protein [Dothidotthia symphoricarpi CBS 119687]KAF2127901.1 multispanning membrane protein [Dothidotthia symphoricarpi CBS 119687]